MPLRTQLVRLLDEEIPFSPGEFRPEAREVSINVAKWQRQHPEEKLTVEALYNTLTETFNRFHGTAAAQYWSANLHRVAARAIGQSTTASEGEV
jgi:hypothetical protein